MVLNRADECRQRADECRRGAARAADDVLRVTYLDLARRWREMAHIAESLERKAMAPNETNTALANAGHDTRLIQDWLGHRAIQHTARYTELSPTRFKDVWR